MDLGNIASVVPVPKVFGLNNVLAHALENAKIIVQIMQKNKSLLLGTCLWKCALIHPGQTSSGCWFFDAFSRHGVLGWDRACDLDGLDVSRAQKSFEQ